MVEHGSHEAVVWGLVGEGGMPQPDLFTAAGTFGLPQYFVQEFSRRCWKSWLQQGNVSWVDNLGQGCQTSSGEKEGVCY